MDYPLTTKAASVKASAVREILKLTQDSATVSFAGGLPAEELFPSVALREAFDRVFERGNSVLQYGLTEGYHLLRELLAARMNRKGMQVHPDLILSTTGSQQAIDLMSRVCLDPGDVVLVENPTYLAALQVFSWHGAKVIAVAADEEGIDPEDLQDKFHQYRPRFLYVTPTFSNPSGKVWSAQRRLDIVKLCRTFGLLILEDDPYGDIQFDDDARYPTMYSLDEYPDEPIVVYTSTFSKTVVPGLRSGWIVGGAPLMDALKRAKQAADLHSSSVDQQALAHLLRDFDLDGHIARIREEYKRRKDLMTSLLARHPWDDLSWNDPKGGMFLWLRLPDEMDAEELLRLAVQEGVAFVPGTEFYVGTPKRNRLRMNFTHTSPERLTLGVDRFARAVTRYTEEVSVPHPAR